MRDITLAVFPAATPRFPCSPRPRRPGPRRQRRPAGLLDLPIAGHQPPARGPQDIVRRKKGAAGGIGVEWRASASTRYIPCSVHRAYRQRSDFGRLELEHPADQHRTPDVRSDQPHLPARPVIDAPVPFVAEHAEYGDADGRPVDNRAKEIDMAQRLRPLTIQFGLTKSEKG